MMRGFVAVGASMGTRERRQRQLEEREQLIIDVAWEAVREQGLLKLQMSRIAERCEYAVGTLYQHFASKEDLLLAVTTCIAREHAAMLQRVADWSATPRERMFAIAVADMIFVLRNPDYFRLAQYTQCEVVWEAASLARRQALLACIEPIGEVVCGIVDDAVAAGDLALRGLSAYQLGIGCWALADGTHNLVHTRGILLEPDTRASYRLMCRHMQTLLNGFGWQPLAKLDDEAALDALIERIRRDVFGDLCPAL